MANITNLGDVFEIEDVSTEAVKLKLKTQDNFEGVGRLTGREQMILIFKANSEHDLKFYVYLKDNSVIFADCDSKLSDIHKWQLPAIIEFLQGNHIDIGPTDIYAKLGKGSKEKQNKVELKKSSDRAYIQNNTSWLQNNIDSLRCEAPIDPKFGTSSQKLFFDVVKTALIYKVKAGDVFNWRPVENQTFSMEDCKFHVVYYVQGFSHPESMECFYLIAYEDNDNLAQAHDILRQWEQISEADRQTLKLPNGVSSSPYSDGIPHKCFALMINENNINKTFHDIACSFLEDNFCVEKISTSSTSYLENTLGKLRQETPTDEPERLAYSRLGTVDQNERKRFSELLVLVSRVQNRGRVVFEPTVTVPYMDGENVDVCSITVKEGSYDLVLNLKNPIPYTNRYDFCLSDKFCPKVVSQPLVNALEKMVENA